MAPLPRTCPHDCDRHLGPKGKYAGDPRKAERLNRTRGRTPINSDLPAMRRCLDGNDADRRVPVFLRLPTLWRSSETPLRRLLRLLFLCRCPLSTDPGGESQRQLGGLLFAKLMAGVAHNSPVPAAYRSERSPCSLRFREARSRNRHHLGRHLLPMSLDLLVRRNLPKASVRP